MTTTDRRRGTYRVPGDPRVYVLPGDIKELDAAWDAYLGTRTAPDPVETEGERGEVDMSPEAVAERARLKRRREEALAFCANYTGTFGLILDIRANPRFGTKHMRLTDRQADAILASRDRDIARAGALVAQQPVVDRVRAAMGRMPPPDFITSILAQHRSGRALSDRQLDAIDRWAEQQEALSHATDDPRPTPPQAAGLEAQPASGPPVVSDGWYVLDDGTIWKVQWNRERTARYAKKLDPEHARWDYVQGGLRVIAARGRALTVEEAAAFGKLYGTCAICGRTLTDEKSIADGIGPVCITKL